MSQSQVQLEDVDDRDISEMAEETGLEEDILRSSIEAQKADDKYKKVDQTNSESNTRSKLTVAKNATKFILSNLVRNPDVPKSGEVISVETVDENTINIEVEAPYPELPHEERSDDTMTESKSYDLETEKQDLDFILNKAGVSKPSDLIGENIPIIPRNRTSTSRLDIASFEIPEYPVTFAEKLDYSAERYFIRTKSIERFSKFTDTSLEGEWFPNRNIFLSLSILLFGMSFIINTANATAGLTLLRYATSVTMVIGGLLGAVYAVLLLRGLGCGLYDYATNKPDEREYIKQIIEK